MPDLTVTFLGTVAARFLPPSNTAAQLVSLGDTHLLVDCGAGAVRQLHRTGASVHSLAAVLITHWHPDHVAGLPRLARRLAKRRSAPLPVYGPAAPWWARGILRIASGGRPPIELISVSGSGRVSLPGWLITAIPTDHLVESLGWLMEEQAPADTAGRRIVISGDTRPSDAIAEAARGASLLIHESTYLARLHHVAQRLGHSTATEAAQIAREAAVGRLALTHFGVATPREAARAEAQVIFERVTMARDLDRLAVPPAGES